MDKKLRIKSKVLYNEFNIPTRIIEPKELISELSEVLDDIENKENFLDEAIGFCKEGSLVESYPPQDEASLESYAFKLPKFYFNIYSNVFYPNFTNNMILILTFEKESK